MNERRINRFLIELAAVSEKLVDVEYNVLMKRGKYSSPQEAQASNEDWIPFDSNSRWGGLYSHAWFRVEASISEESTDRELIASVSTEELPQQPFAAVSSFVRQEKKPWDIMNPQFIVYVNGELWQGMDVNHRRIRLGPCQKDDYRLEFSAYGGMNDRLFPFLISFSTEDAQTAALCMDIDIALQCAQRLEDHDIDKVTTMNLLQQVVDRIPLHLAEDACYHQAILEARALLKAELYSKMEGYSETTAMCVGHTHIDVGWLWTVAQTRDKAIRSFSTVVKLMERYPDYVFMSSQPQLYQFIKEDAPLLYARIQELAKQGRWETEGAAWVEPDCNMISGESLTRQLMYGKRFFLEEFQHDSRIMWLPDVFGYSASMPQILKLAGVQYFLTSKISWNHTNQLPCDAFFWKGIDGTEILSYFLTARSEPDPRGFYTTYNSDLTPYAIEGGWRRFQQKDLFDIILIAYGYGDGGGGPSEQMLENAMRLEHGIPGCPRVEMNTALRFFEKLEEKTAVAPGEFPKWQGELYLENHQGTYTSMATMKRLNRRCEQVLQEAEAWCVVSGMQSSPLYGRLQKDWPVLLINQFHDILPGTCIKEVYDVTVPQLESVIEHCEEFIQVSLHTISQQSDNRVTVCNSLAHMRDGIVKIPIPDSLLGSELQLVDTQGNEYSCVADGDDGFAQAFVRSIPPVGMKCFTIQESPPKKAKRNHTEREQRCLENDYFRIELDDHGAFMSMYDKRCDREILKPQQVGNVLLFLEDRPESWDAWNIEDYAKRKKYGPDSLEIGDLKQDALSSSICITSKFHQSTIHQIVRLPQYQPVIEMDFEVDWHESGIFCKLSFPLDINSDYITSEIPFGSVKRSINDNTSWQKAQYEMCAHRWLDLSECGYGVSFFNDSKYGFDANDGIINLSLLKSARAPFPGIDEGEHHFRYAIYPHYEGWEQANTVRMAAEFNRPLRTIPRNGDIDGQSFVHCSASNVIIETIKPAEDGNGTILRLYESANRQTSFTLDFLQTYTKIVTCDLLERQKETLADNATCFTAKIRPFEIQTYRLVPFSVQ